MQREISIFRIKRLAKQGAENRKEHRNHTYRSENDQKRCRGDSLLTTLLHTIHRLEEKRG